MALAARISAVFRFGMIAALLVAISGGGYYYAIYAPKAAAESSYQACVNGAAAAHDASWAAECKRLAGKVSEDRSNCLLTLKLPRSYCETSYKDLDASPKCTLPTEVATVFDAALERAKYRCERDREAAE